MSLSFFVSEMNMDFLPDLDFNWLAEFDQEQYTILNPTIDAISKGKSIDAMLKFFTDFGGMYLQDEAEDKNMTALNAYTELFQGTGKTVHLVDNFHSNTLNYQKNQSRLERFHYYNTRFNAEFVVRGDAVYLYNKIGSYKPDVRIDEDLNVKSATVEIDSENFFTWCKCYFDLEESEGGADGENYLQDAVYVNQELYDEYGDIEGPALYQGAIKYESTMLEYAREQQEKSVQVSHSVDLVDLQRQGYGEFIFHIGDTVRLSLSSIDITLDIRVVEINETFVENAHGEWERTELSLTLGNASKVQSYKRSRNDSLQDLDDWINGRREPPMSVVPAAIRRAADIVTGDTDSVMEYRKDRLIGWHSKNEGNNVQLNVSGLVLHQNGVPKTAITPWGIVADTITTGMLNTNNVKIQGTSGRMTMDGDLLTLRNTSGTRQMDVQYGEIESIYNGELAMKFGGYTMEFYNQRNDQIGRIGPLYSLGARRPGLALIVEKDIINIGYNIGGIYRPTFRSDIADEADGRPITTVNGPFNNANEGARLHLFANRRIVSSDTPFENEYSATDQPALLLDQSSSTNNATLYFGGVNRRRGAEFAVRYNTGPDSWASRIIAGTTTVTLGASADSSGATGNRFTDYRTTQYQGNNGVAFSLMDGSTTAGQVFLGYNIAALIGSDTSSSIWVGGSGSGGYVRSDTIRSNTTTWQQDYVQISSSGTLRRITSSRRNKLNEKEIGLEYSKRLLDIKPKTWHDKTAVEQYAEFLTTGEASDDQEADSIRPVPGIIAEDVHAAGLTDFVAYDKAGRPDSINHNLPYLMLPVVKDHDKRVEKLEDEISELINRLEKIENAG